MMVWRCAYEVRKSICLQKRQNKAMTPEQFIAKWENSTLKERSASQSHFNDLCSVLAVENPIDADQKGDWYCFERGASKTVGGEGWADVWKRGHFGWEYKGKRKDLKAAFAQLQQYAVALENPPLLVVSDMDRIIVHTNWTNTVSETHEIKLEELSNPHKRELLRWVFLDPNRLKPQKTIDALTREVADKFASLAIRLRDRGFDAKVVAHFVNRLVFCMFAEDINLLPRQLFSQILDKSHTQPALSEKLLSQLFASMKKGGLFGVDEIKWFNGGLFDDSSAIPLTRDELKLVGEAAALDWSDIDPSIFGTLFERGLDPAKRSQLGAHYTDPEKIMMIVRPVIIEPLWAEWEGVKAAIQKPRTSEKRKRELLAGFLEQLKNFRVLDPACGSGNFLYLALLALKDIEHRVNLDAEAMGFGKQLPAVGPEAVLGIELNPYAAELARVSVWIGEIQWMRKNGFGVSDNPILKPLRHIENRDALVSGDGAKADWPKADVIIGNPPFLGDRLLIGQLGREESEAIRSAYYGDVPRGADLVCYWFEKSRIALQEGKSERVGLVSTNSIRGGQNRKVLAKAASNFPIFEAWSDEPWIVDGAAVRVSITCFGKGVRPKKLNGVICNTINDDLTSDSFDLTIAKKLASNNGYCVHGSKKIGSFDIDGEFARHLLQLPLNPNGRPNSDVIFPVWNGADVTGRPADRWIIDFGMHMTEAEAALYEAPFKHVLEIVKPERLKNNNPILVKKWWLHGGPRPAMRNALPSLSRCIGTPAISKHRIFVWVYKPVLPDAQLMVTLRDDDVTFGILHSKFHELWTLRLCTYLGVGNDPRYTPSTTFDTFPFPEGMSPNVPVSNILTDPRSHKIADAAKNLDKLRSNWLNPSDLIITKPEVKNGYSDRILPVNEESAKQLKQKTLTNLYNLKPSWLITAHKALDDAVAEAYGWPVDLSEDDILVRLLTLNLERAAKKEAA